MSESPSEHADPSLPAGGGAPTPLPTYRRDVPRGIESDVTAISPSPGGDSLPDVTYLQSYPDRIGEYELLEELARGGMGVVFKARHVRLQRIVALKIILHGQLASADNHERFRLEATTTAQLQHQGIVAIYEYGFHDNQPYIAMEFIDGTSLAQRVEEGPLPSLTAASYLEKISRAVHCAHVNQILHRDLKPANVLIDPHDVPKVTDFGLAKYLQEDSRQTKSGVIMGTPSYMAPEQALARKQLTPACDIYSLGAILYETLTGRPPFQGETPMATMTMVIEQDPVPPRQLNPHVDVDLETICLKCLEKEPSRRYLSAEALANDLRNYLESRPIVGRRVGPLGRTIKWCRRNKSAAALIAVSAIASIALVVGGLTFGVVQHNLREQLQIEAERAREAEQEARAHESKALESAAIARSNETVSRFMLYVAHFRLARTAWESANLERADYWLSRLFQDERREDRLDPRRWEWYFLKGLCQGKSVLSLPPNRKVTALAYRADGTRLASADDSGAVQIWDVPSGKLLRALKVHDYTVWAIAFAADGKHLVTSTGDKADGPGEVKVWDTESGLEAFALTRHPRLVHAVAFSGDGRYLATAGADGIVRIWDARLGNLVRTCSGHDGPVRRLAFSADNQRLASAADVLKREDSLKVSAAEIKVWRLDQENEPLTLRMDRNVIALSFPKSDRLIAAGADQQAVVWNAVTGDKQRGFAFLAPGASSVTISPDGDMLATCTPDHAVTVWDTATGKERFSSLWHMQNVQRMTFNPDGRRLVCACEDGSIWLGHSIGGQEAIGLEGHTASVRGLGFSADGKQLVSAGEDGVHLWSGGEGTPAGSVKRLSAVTALACNPRGDGFAVAVRESDPLKRRSTVRLYNAAGTKETAVLHGHESPVRALAYSADGSVLASGDDDKTILLWNARSGDPIGTLRGHASGIVTLAFHPKNGTLVSAGTGEDVIHVWDLTARRQVRALKGHGNGIVSLAFSPNGEKLASGSFDKTIRVWDTASGTDLFTLEGHSKVVNSVAFSPDGARLVSGGGDHSVRVWDMLTRQELLKLDGGTRDVNCVAFSPDGRCIAAGGHDRIIRVWAASTWNHRSHHAPREAPHAQREDYDPDP